MGNTNDLKIIVALKLDHGEDGKQMPHPETQNLINCWLSELKHAKDLQRTLNVALCGMVIIFIMTFVALVVDHFCLSNQKKTV